MPSTVFSSGTFEPNKKNNKIFSSRYKKILTVSREKFSKPRSSVEAKINKMLNDVEIQEKNWDKKKEEFEAKKKEEKAKKHRELMEKQNKN
jgi:hypothetical protein